MGWKRDWINVWIDKTGDDQHGTFLVFSRTARFGGNRGATVRLEETAKSGAVIVQTYSDPVQPNEVVTELPIGPSDQSLSCYGDAEVYVLIRQGNAGRFLSGPLNTSIELKGIVSVQLIILAPLPIRLKGMRYVYRTNLNGHCVFSVKDDTNYTFDDQIEGLGNNPYLAKLLESSSTSEAPDLAPPT
jgi:hypothetical protein